MPEGNPAPPRPLNPDALISEIIYTPLSKYNERHSKLFTNPIVAL